MDKKNYSYEVVVRFIGEKSKKVDEKLVFSSVCSSDDIEDVLSFIYDTSAYYCNQFLPEYDVHYFIDRIFYKII